MTISDIRNKHLIVDRAIVNSYSEYPEKLFWTSEIVICDIQHNYFGYLK